MERETDRERQTDRDRDRDHVRLVFGIRLSESKWFIRSYVRERSVCRLGLCSLG